MPDHSCPRINRIQGLPNIGSFYWVPCLTPTPCLLECTAIFGPKRSWYEGVRPVLLPGHSDPELGLPFHYHIDLRFLSNERLNDWQKASSFCNKLEDLMAHIELQVCNPIEEVEFFELQWLKLPCYRQLPEFSLFYFATIEFKLRTFIGQSVICSDLKAGSPARCPHRGISLQGLPRLPDGCVICPGHGLKIDLDSGKVVPRDVSHLLAYTQIAFWVQFQVELPIRILLLEFELSTS